MSPCNKIEHDKVHEAYPKEMEWYAKHSWEEKHSLRTQRCCEYVDATTVQNDVIEGRFINSMNKAMDAQDEYVIMQLMMGNMIMMYEYAIKIDHNKFSKKMHKLIYHG